jgi:hypothetical protein
MFRILLFAYVLLGVFDSTSSAAARRSVSSWIYGRPSVAELSELSQKEKEVCIAELREYANTASNVRLRNAQRLLIRLGDVETAEKVVSELNTVGPAGGEPDRAAEVFSGVTQPWVIPMFEQALMRDEEVAGWTMDKGQMPRSALAAGVICAIVRESPAFPDDVRQWAKYRFADPLPVIRQQVRDWWAQNKEHFAKQDYAAVQPLQPTGTAPTPPSPAAKAESAPIPVPATEPQPAAKPAPLPAAPAPPEPSASPWSVLVGVLLLILVAGLVVVLIRGKRQS